MVITNNNKLIKLVQLKKVTVVIFVLLLLVLNKTVIYDQDVYSYKNINCINKYKWEYFFRYYSKQKYNFIDLHYNNKILIYNNFIMSENCLKYLLSSIIQFETVKIHDVGILVDTYIQHQHTMKMIYTIQLWKITGI